MENESRPKHCPKCGKENPDDVRYCSSCGCLLTQASAARIEVKISPLAMASFICALCVLVLLAPSLIALGIPRVLSPRRGWVAITFLLSHIFLVVSFILGFLGIVQIERSGGRITGRMLAVGAVLISVFGGLLPAWTIYMRLPRSTAFRMVCGTNLSGLGKAMLIYAGDYDEVWPFAGGSNSTWAARIHDWRANNPFDAFDLQADKSGGQASISSSFYFLVKYCDVKPKSFVCKQDDGTTEFRPAMYDVNNSKLIDLWDFGPNPPRHCSYSYHQPYGSNRLTTAAEPGLAVAAGRNPWMDSPFKKARDFQAFDPNGSIEAIRAGNTVAHKTDGQNVLFIDCHVSFEKRSFCGVNKDNIYTHWNGGDIRRGTPPRLGSQPADKSDSLLVNDPSVP
jgi:hypothetical protein